MAKKILRAPADLEPPSPRAVLGLTGAERGDVAAAERFVRYISSELAALGLTSSLPVAVRDRMLSLHREAASVAVFAQGYVAAQSDTAERM